jgi:hypothetical protein
MIITQWIDLFSVNVHHLSTITAQSYIESFSLNCKLLAEFHLVTSRNIDIIYMIICNL